MHCSVPHQSHPNLCSASYTMSHTTRTKKACKPLRFYYFSSGDQEADNEKHEEYEHGSISQMSFRYPIRISV